MSITNLTNEVNTKKNKKSIIIKKEILEKISAQINKGGTTYGPLLNKDYSGTRNIAIAPFPERSQILGGKVTKEIVKCYCDKNRDLLQKGFPVGGWFDQNNLITYLDITAPIPLEKESEAIALGKNANQIAGFNLFNSTEILLGGTGKISSLITPFRGRLREALSLMTTS